MMFVEKADNLYEAINEDEAEPSHSQSEIEDLVKKIERARVERENIKVAERPIIPKVSVNRKVELLIKQANQAIQLVIAEITKMEEKIRDPD